MGFFKKIFRAVTKPIKAIVDPVIDLGTSIVKAVISPFTGAFDLPDVAINTDVTSSEIKAATVVDFNGANRPVPVLYGTRLETATIPVFIGTFGDNSADTSRQYLYMAAVISQGFHGSNTEIGVNGAMGSLISRILIDGKPVHLGGLTNTANPNYSAGYDGSTALNLQDSDGGIFASGKGGVQPAQHTITKGTFANRLKIQYFDGSADQPVSSLLNEHPEFSPTGQSKLSGMHYVALRFLIQAADVTVSGSDGNGTFGNPYSGVPAVVVTTSGRGIPNLIASKASDPGYEERFDTNYADKDKTRFISYHLPLGGVNSNGEINGDPAYEKNAVHVESVPTSTQFEMQRFDKFQREKFSDGTTQPFNIHNILYGLGWTYDWVYFTPRTVSIGANSNITNFGSISTISGDFSHNNVWLKHVGGGHYELATKVPVGYKIQALSGAFTFFGYNDDGNVESKINLPQPGEDVGTDSAEYRFYAPDNVTQAIENAHLAGHDMTLRIRVRETNQNDTYNITGVDLNSAANFITLGITNEDSSKPPDHFYRTVPINAEIYVEVSDGNTNTDKFPASYDVTFASGSYKTEGLGYEGYRVDNNVVEYILDYLLNPNYGFGITLDQIHRESFIEAAIAVDRLPEFFDFDRTIFNFGGTNLSVFDRNEYMYGEAATTGASVNGARFRTLNNGYDRQFIINPAKTFISNLNQMLSSIGAIMFLVDGKFRIKLENAGDVDDSERIPPITALPLSATITDDEIIESVGVSTSSLNDRFNQIKVDYTDLANNSQPNSVLSPHPVEDSTDIRQNYLNEDGGKVLEGNFSFPGIFDSVTAQKHATLLLKKSRGQPRVTLQASPGAIDTAPGDFIRLNSVALGVNDVYRVTETTLNPDHTVVINAIKHVPDFYDVTDTGQKFEAQRDVLSG